MKLSIVPQHTGHEETHVLGSEEFRILEAARDPRPNSGPMAGVFLGKARFDLVSPFPQAVPHREEFSFWLENLKEFLLEKVDPEAIEESGEIPKEVLAGLKKMGAFGLIIPKQYGGLGLSYAEYYHVFVVVGSWCLNIAVLLSAANSIGVIAPLKNRGTEEQREEILPQCAAGEITGLALTEKQSGSDPSAKTLLARRVYNEAGEYTGLRVSGETLWTTNAVRADGIKLARYIAVVAKIHKNQKEELAGKDPHHMVLFILDTNSPGFSTPIRCRFGGTKALYNGVLKFDDVFIEKKWIVADELKGFKYAFESLVFGRFSLAAGGVGVLKQLLQVARWWGKERIQGGNPIGTYELKAEDIVSVAAHTFAMEALVQHVCQRADQHEDIRIESAATKILTTRVGWEMTLLTARLRGGRSYETAASQRKRGEPGIGLMRILTSVWIFTIFEGENDVMTMYEVRECMDPYIRVLLKAIAKVSNPVGETNGDDTANEVLPGKAGFSWKEIPEFISLFLTSLREKREKKSATDAYVLFTEDDSPERYKNFIVRHAQRIQRKVWSTAVNHRVNVPRKQIISEGLVHQAENLFLMMLVLSYAELHADKPLAKELAEHFCDMKIEEMTGARARISEEWIRRGAHNSVTGLSRRIMDGEAAWLEGGIISLLEKEGVSV